MKAILLIVVIGLSAASIAGQQSWCRCYNQCRGKRGTLNIGCGDNRGEYIQCVDTVCSTKSCPTNHLFNYASRVCEPCPTGFKVDIWNRTCVCEEGTRINHRTGSCEPCPTGAFITPYTCYCRNSVLDIRTNACSQCPAGSVRSGDACQCSDRTLFWNGADFECQGCPGEWVNVQVGTVTRPRTVSVCQCQGENEIFNPFSVSCVTCPLNSVAVTSGPTSTCKCLLIGQKYDLKRNSCVLSDSSEDSLQSDVSKQSLESKESKEDVSKQSKESKDSDEK